MLWDPEDVENITFENAMRIFTREESSGDYTFTIKASMIYKMAIEHLSSGISMKQTALAIQAAKEVADVSNPTGMNQTKVATFVLVRCTAVPRAQSCYKM